MYPGMMYWWKHARQGGEWGAEAACGPHGGHGGWGWGWEHRGGGGDEGEFGGGWFGVRRPLRFLAYKLGLSEPQVAELAKVLNELKTERAQAAVDHRRTVSAFADAIAGDSFDQKRAAEGAALRTQSAEKLRDAVVKALGRIHALLNPQQREKLAYLIRTGALGL
ncbi:MAG TPA: hypothetical protein VKN99_13710 [Polyangia bacterium]|nr:hypothetical protein [Polyangia bacterium]